MKFLQKINTNYVNQQNAQKGTHMIGGLQGLRVIAQGIGKFSCCTVTRQKIDSLWYTKNGQQLYDVKEANWSDDNGPNGQADAAVSTDPLTPPNTWIEDFKDAPGVALDPSVAPFKKDAYYRVTVHNGDGTVTCAINYRVLVGCQTNLQSSCVSTVVPNAMPPATQPGTQPGQ